MTTVGQWSGRETRILRQALRLTVRDFAEKLGVSPRTVSKWEAGGVEHVPRPELQAALDTALARASDADRDRFAQGRLGAGSEFRYQSPGDSALGRSPDPAGGKDPHQQLADSAAEGAAFVAWWERMSAGPLALDLTFAELRRLAADYLMGPPEPVVRALCRLRDHLLGLLRRPQPPGHARDLHLAAGYACSLLSWVSGDLGHLGAANTQAAVAALFADATSSPELDSWVRAVRSKTSFWQGDYQAAVGHAAIGLSQAPATEVRVLLAAQVADAQAALGATNAAQRALADMWAARETVTGTGAIGGLFSCSPARQANYESGVHHLLGATTKAVTSGESALAQAAWQPIRSYATEAQIRLNLVDVFLDLGDITTADEAIQPVLRLSPERRLHTLTRRVDLMSARLCVDPLESAVGAVDLRERCLDFIRGSAATT